MILCDAAKTKIGICRWLARGVLAYRYTRRRIIVGWSDGPRDIVGKKFALRFSRVTLSTTYRKENPITPYFIVKRKYFYLPPELASH